MKDVNELNNCFGEVGKSALLKNSGERSISPPERKLKLRFSSKLSLPILTGKPILGQDNSPLKIELIDEKTGLIVNSGPESSARVEIVVLRVDPKEDEGREWTSEKFNQNIVTENEKGTSRFKGDLLLNLNKGTGVVDNIYFSNGSIWSKKRDFMLGARFVNSYNGVIVTEAKSEHFTLVDCRNKLYGKNYPPVLTDDVWRLENIRKGGVFYKRLKGENIKTVSNFLKHYFLDPRRLQFEVLKMHCKKFSATVKHGLTCKRDNADKHIYYPPNTQQKAGVIFNAVGELLGVHTATGFVSVDRLSEKDKDDAQNSVATAFESWGDVLRYDESVNPVSVWDFDSLDGYRSPLHLGTPHNNTDNHSPNIFQENPKTIVVYDDTQPATSLSMGIMALNNPSTYSTATDTSVRDQDFLYDFQLTNTELLYGYCYSPLYDQEPNCQGFNNDGNIFCHTSVADDYNDKGQRTWFRRWSNMVLVVRFFLRMRRMEKTDHVRKRTRIREWPPQYNIRQELL